MFKSDIKTLGYILRRCSIFITGFELRLAHQADRFVPGLNEVLKCHTSYKLYLHRSLVYWNQDIKAIQVSSFTSVKKLSSEITVVCPSARQFGVFLGNCSLVFWIFLHDGGEL